MTFQLQCPHCQRVLNVSEQLGGQVRACPGCQQPITIPANLEALQQLKPVTRPPALPPNAAARHDREGRDRRFASSATRSGWIMRVRDWFTGRVVSARRRYAAFQLTREINGLETALRGEFIGLGNTVLDSDGYGLPTAKQRNKLDALSKQIKDREHRLASLAGAKGTGSLQRELRSEMTQLAKDEREILAEVGRLAYGHGKAEQELARRIRDLESLLEQRRNRLSEIGVDSTTVKHELANAGKSTVRGIRALPWRTGLLLVVVGFGLWLAYAWFLKPLFNPLYEFRYDVTENAAYVAVVDMGQLGDHISQYGASKNESTRTSTDNSHIDTLFLTSPYLNFDVPTFHGMFVALGDFSKPETSAYRTRLTYKGYDIIQTAAAEGFVDKERRAMFDQPAQGQCRVSSERMLVGTTDLIQQALDRYQSGSPEEAYDKLCVYAAEVPKSAVMWAAFTKLELPTLRTEFLRGPQLEYVDFTVDGGMVYVLLSDEGMRFVAKIHFPDSSEARFFRDYIDRTRNILKSLSQDIERVQSVLGYRYIDRATGARILDELLSNLEVVQDEQHIIVIKTSITERLVRHVFESGRVEGYFSEALDELEEGRDDFTAD